MALFCSRSVLVIYCISSGTVGRITQCEETVDAVVHVTISTHALLLTTVLTMAPRNQYKPLREYFVQLPSFLSSHSLFAKAPEDLIREPLTKYYELGLQDVVIAERLKQYYDVSKYGIRLGIDTPGIICFLSLFLVLFLFDGSARNGTCCLLVNRNILWNLFTIKHMIFESVFLCAV